jgi:uncharacterized protein (DUF427 family)
MPDRDYPQAIAPDHVEPVPRRVRAVAGGRVVVDTTRAIYVWEWPAFPQYYVPLGDIDGDALVDEQRDEQTPRGPARGFGLRAGDAVRPNAVLVFGDDAPGGLAGMVRFDWAAMDAWFEEDDEVFVHPRNPYSRVDAVRSTRTVRVEIHGVVLAESSAPVMVFETGLPTRYYLPRPAISFEHLVPSDTVTDCPYKGRTTGYWSATVGGRTHPDIAWAYDFPTAQVLPIAGLVAFYNEKVDTFIDGRPVERPRTHFS